jgi:hypothetical protein
MYKERETHEAQITFCVDKEVVCLGNMYSRCGSVGPRVRKLGEWKEEQKNSKIILIVEAGAGSCLKR